METKFHQISVKVGERESMPLMLHENIAEGTVDGRKVTLGRNTSGKLLLIAVGDRNYICDLADLVQGIIDNEKKEAK